MKLINQNLMGRICTTFIFIALLNACAPATEETPPSSSTPVLQVDNIQVTEGDSGLSTATVNITLSSLSDKIVSVNYATEDDSASAPGDYQSRNGTVTFAAGETAQSFTINIVSDTQPEADESFNINFSNPQNVTLGATTVTAVIEDDDSGATLPALQVGDVNITEGNSGTTTAEFSVTLSTSSAATVTIDYTTSDMTATAPGDYQSKNGSLSFAPGETSKTVIVNVVADVIVELDETFKLTLSNPNNANLSNAVGVATITNDDIATLPALQVGNINIAEGNSGTTTAEFSVTLSANSASAVTVDYATSDTTATAPNDYQSKSGSLSFAPGETSKTVTVNVVADAVAELDETFKLTLSNPGNADLSDAVGVATITNDDTDSTVLLSNPGPQSFDEEKAYTIDVTARANARIFVSGMPPGMLWDEFTRRFDFRPDFIQGGKSWQITMEAVDGAETDTQTFMVTVNNTIQPPWPALDEEKAIKQLTGAIRYTVTQTTDGFLDSPGYAGREFTANLVIPTAASATNPLPVKIGLHGFGGSTGDAGGAAGFFGIAPHDPKGTWWTGYNEHLPFPEPGPGEDRKKISEGTIPNYTQRRVMHLLSYLMNGCPGLINNGENACPGVDPERIAVSGQSMGGTGSFFLAINYGYHFAEVASRIGGTIPRFLSPGSQDGLIRFHWGAENLGLPDEKGTNVWDLYDSSEAALKNKHFRNLHYSTISGKNDPTVNFDAMVRVSPVSGRSFFAALQDEGIGHFSIWDLRAHHASEQDLLKSDSDYPGLGPTPLGRDWWSPLDDISFLSRTLAFPAFSNGSGDDDAGLPDGMGGYTGTLRGAKNRYLRWDSANIIDTRDQLSMPIKADIDTTGTPPAAGYPPTGNNYFGLLPITANVTIRRIQQFQMLPGETIHWSYNGKSGTVSANDDGSVTVLDLEIATSFTPLVFTRP